MFNSLKEFAGWYYLMSGPTCTRLQVDVPVQDPVKVSEGSYELVLFRRGQYQAELITLYAGQVVQPHRHPDVSSMDIHLHGTGEAVVAGRVMPPASFQGDPMSTSRRLSIPRRVLHWGHADTDVVVISLQRWHNGVRPTFITDNWEGDPWR